MTTGRDLPSNAQVDRFDTKDERGRRFARIGARPRFDLCSRDGAISLWLADFPAYEGNFAWSDRLNIYMGLRGSGRMVRLSPAQRLNASFHPGRVGISVPQSGGEGRWDDLQFLGIGVRLSSIVAEDGRALGPDAFVPCASRLHDDALLTAVLTAMWREADAHGRISAFFEHGLMIAVNRLLLSEPNTLPCVRPLSQEQLRRVIERMEDAIAEDLSVAELAAIAGMSRHHFSRAFKVSTGFPPYEYLTRRRVERAKEMLAMPNSSITRIAYLVGFTSPSHFAAAFRRVTGHTPTAWRRQY